MRLYCGTVLPGNPVKTENTPARLELLAEVPLPLHKGIAQPILRTSQHLHVNLQRSIVMVVGEALRYIGVSHLILGFLASQHIHINLHPFKYLIQVDKSILLFL